jgi:hypothetical protein
MRIIDNLTLLLLYYQKDFNNSSREDLVKGRRSLRP